MSICQQSRSRLRPGLVGIFLGLGLLANSAAAQTVTVNSFTLNGSTQEAHGLGPVITTDTATFSLLLSGPVVNVDATDFEVFDSSFAPVGAAGPQVTSIEGSGQSYTITLTRNSGVGSHRIDFAATNNIQPVGGGTFNPALPGSPLVVLTGGRPFLSQWLEVNPATGEPFGVGEFPDWGNSAYFRLVFSEPVQNFDVADIVFPFWAGPPPGPSVTSITGGPTTWDFSVSANGGTGFANIAIGTGATINSVTGARPLVNDPSGIPGPQLELSGGAPVGSLGLILTPRNTMPNLITFRYDEPVTGVTTGIVTVDRSDGAGGWTNVPFTGTLVPVGTNSFSIEGITYGASTPDGDYRVTLAVGAVEDVDGNPPAAGDEATFRLDQTPPQLLSATTTAVSPVGPGSIEYIFTFSEPISDFGPLDLAKVLTGTATATSPGGFTQVPGQPNQVRVGVDLGGTGTISLGCLTGSVFDAAGNGNVAGAFSTPLEVNSTPPDLVTFSTGLSNPTAAAPPLVFNLQWNQVVTGFETSDIEIDTLSSGLTFVSAVLANKPGGVAGRDFTFTISGITAGNNGQLRLTIDPNAVQSPTGIGNETEIATQTVDGQAPSATITTAEASPTFDTVLDWTISFDEIVVLPIRSAVPSSPEVALDVTGTSSFVHVSQVNQNPAEPDTRNYRFTAAGVSGGGTLTPRIAAGAIQDRAGNVNTAAIVGTSIQRDSTAIQVGNVLVDATGTTITNLGSGNYDIGAGARIGGLLCNAPIQVRGTTISGTGSLILPLRLDDDVTLYTGAFTVNATTEIVTLPAPQASAFTWNTVPIGLCSISLDGGVAIDGWFDVADFAGNSFKGMRLGENTDRFRPQLDSIILGNASCNPTQSRTYVASVAPVIGSNPLIQITPTFVPSIRNPVLRLTASELRAEGFFQDGADRFVFFYNDVTTTAAGFEFNSFAEPEPGIFLAFDELKYNNVGGFQFSSTGTITNEAGNLDVTFEINPPYNAELPLQNVVVHTTTAFGDVELEGLTLIGSGGGTFLFFDAASSVVTLADIPFTCDGAPEFSSTDGFSAGTIALFDLKGVSLAYDSLVVNTTTVALGGGGLELLGLAFNASVTTPEAGVGLTISGGFALPSNIGALSGVSLGATFTVSAGPRIDIEGLEFCTPEAGALKIKKSNFNLPQLCFKYTNNPVEEIEADLTISIPEVVDIAAGGSVRDGKVDRISLGVDGLNLAIDATGAFLQSISASVRNLSRTEREWTETYYQFNEGAAPTEITRTLNSVPPIQVKGTVGATAGPDIGPLPLIEAEVETTIDETQLRMDGTVTLLVVNVGGGYIHARWSGPTPGVILGGYMTYLLVIRGDIVAALDVAGNFAGCAAVTLQIPEGLPFAGEQFGGVSACVTAPPFVIRGCLLILDVELCLTISSDGSVDFGRSSELARYRDWDTPFFAPMPMESKRALDGESVVLYMSMFSNYRLASKAYNDGLPVELRGGGSATVPVTVTAGKGRVVRLTYEAVGGNPAFRLTTPSGTTYTPDQTLGAIDPATAPAVFFSSASRREAGFILRNAEAGTHTVEILNVASLGAYSVEVLEPGTDPTISITDAQIAGSTLNVEWTDSDPDSNAVIHIGLDTDRVGANGTRILSGISEDSATNMASYDLATSPIQPGFYWLYATIEDGGAPVVSYAERLIFIPDVDASSPILDFQVSGANGDVSASFTPISDPDVVSYKLSWTDDPNGWDLVNATAIPDGESSVFLQGFKLNQPYKFVLAAVSLVDSSAASRAARFDLLEAGASAAKSVRPGRQFAEAQAAIDQALASRAFALGKGEREALASQAVEVAQANARWEQPTRTEAFRAFVRSESDKARTATRMGTPTRRYVDSHFAVADNVIFRRSPGQNNAPQFVGAAPVNVRRGETYTYQLVATDIDGDTVTFARVSGPSGLTVSPSGLITWNTAGVAQGDYPVVVSASDPAGATAQAEWILGVAAIVTPADFAIVSTPEPNSRPSSTWTYQPVLGGASDDATPSWTLVEGPSGMSVNPVSGLVSFSTAGITLPASGLASYRVVIRAAEGGVRNRIAVQEFILDVEGRADQLGNITLSVTGSSFVIE